MVSIKKGRHYILCLPLTYNKTLVFIFYSGSGSSNLKVWSTSEYTTPL